MAKKPAAKPDAKTKKATKQPTTSRPPKQAAPVRDHLATRTHPPRDRPVWNYPSGAGVSTSTEQSAGGQAVPATPAKSADKAQTFLLGGLALSVLLLAVSAVPRWVISGHRFGIAIATHRENIATIGLSALFAVELGFMIQYWPQ